VSSRERENDMGRVKKEKITSESRKKALNYKLGSWARESYMETKRKSGTKSRHQKKGIEPGQSRGFPNTKRREVGRNGVETG